MLGKRDGNPYIDCILRPEGKATEMSPQVDYDAEANAAYIRLSSASVLESEEVSPGIVFDFDADGHIVGIELLDAKTQLSQELLTPAA